MPAQPTSDEIARMIVPLLERVLREDIMPVVRRQLSDAAISDVYTQLRTEDSEVLRAIKALIWSEVQTEARATVGRLTAGAVFDVSLSIGEERPASVLPSIKLGAEVFHAPADQRWFDYDGDRYWIVADSERGR